MSIRIACADTRLPPDFLTCSRSHTKNGHPGYFGQKTHYMVKSNSFIFSMKNGCPSTRGVIKWGAAFHDVVSYIHEKRTWGVLRSENAGITNGMGMQNAMCSCICLTNAINFELNPISFSAMQSQNRDRF